MEKVDIGKSLKYELAYLNRFGLPSIQRKLDRSILVGAPVENLVWTSTRNPLWRALIRGFNLTLIENTENETN